MQAERMTFDFEFTVAAGGSTVEWYMEFTSENPNAPTTRWKREVAEEDIGGGVVHMPNVVRDFVLLAGAAARSCQFVRAHRFCRLQIRVSAGAATSVRIDAPFGLGVAAP